MKPLPPDVAARLAAIPRRASANEKACAEFRKLLTEGFYTIDADGEIDTPVERQAALDATKPWRNDLWKAFRALEDRLCPYKAFEEGRA